MLKIKKINNTFSERRKIIELHKEIFPEKLFEKHNSDGLNRIFLRQIKHCLLSNNDVKILYKNKIIGFYLFQDAKLFEVINDGNEIYPKENLEKYNKKRGIEGFVLGILPKYRKIGAGSALIDYVKKELSKEYDYIWGGAYKDLNNINFWLKSRRIISETNQIYYTLMDLK